MRLVFTEINAKLTEDVEAILQAHILRCAYESLRTLAIFDVSSSFQTGKWFGDRNTSFTQQWPTSKILEETQPWQLNDLRITEIEYYAPPKYYIYGLRVKLSDGR
jgi:hypothetical protein